MGLVDYVTNTPQNTNKTILKQLVRDERNKAVYESVEDLKKNGGAGYIEPAKVIAWDGDTAGLPALPYGEAIGYKVSDDVVDLLKVTKLVRYDFELDPNLWRVTKEGIVQILGNWDQPNRWPYVAVVPQDIEVEGYAISKGTYFVEEVRSIEITGTIHPIDPKYLPKGGFGYTETETNVEILPEITLEISDEETYITTPFELVAGNTYTVIWNGVEYSCVAQEIEGEGVAVGNIGAAMGGIDTGEPFIIGYIAETLPEGIYGIVMPLDGSTSAVVSIVGNRLIHRTIDPKYLPGVVNSNLVNGSSSGSLRTTLSTVESDIYTMGKGAFAEGYRTYVRGDYSHAEGYYTTANGSRSHAEGEETTASGGDSHAEGCYTTASGGASHAEGTHTTASGYNSHAEGGHTTAEGDYSHAEGGQTTVSGNYSHAEGHRTTASGYNSHAEGDEATASGSHSHAEGLHTTAEGECSHAEGYYTTASGSHSHVQGKYNIEDTENKYAHIVGNGSITGARSNAHTLDWDGNAWFAGGIELTSPNGTRYRFTVADDGTLSAAVVS